MLLIIDHGLKGRKYMIEKIIEDLSPILRLRFKRIKEFINFLFHFFFLTTPLYLNASLINCPSLCLIPD